MSRFKSTDTRSNEFDTDEQKVRFVRRYFAHFSEIISAEFHIAYHALADGDRYDMRAAFLVSPSDCDDWLAPGDLVHPISERVLEWFGDILPNDGRWRHASIPEIRQRADGHALIVAYRSEGIILKRVCEPVLPWLGERPRPSAENSLQGPRPPLPFVIERPRGQRR